MSVGDIGGLLRGLEAGTEILDLDNCLFPDPRLRVLDLQDHA